MKVAGTGVAPDFEGTLNGRSLAGRWGNLEWSGLDLDVEIAPSTVSVVGTASDFMGGRLRVRGDLPVGDRSGSSGIDFEVEEIDLLRLVDGSGDSSRMVVTTSGRLEGDAGDLSRLIGGGTLERLEASLQGVSASLLAPAAWSLRDGVLDVGDLEIVGNEMQLVVRPRVSLANESASVSVVGDLDLAIVNTLLPPGEGFGVGGLGEFDLVVRVEPSGEVSWEGTGNLDRATVNSTEPAITLTDGSAGLRFSGTEIIISDLVGRVGGGEVRGGGRVDTDRLRLSQADLSVDLDQIGMEVAEGATIVADGRLSFSGSGEDWALSGELRVLQGLLDQDLDFSSEESQTIADLRFALRELSEESFLRSVDLDVRVVTEGRLHIDNELASIAMVGDLRLRGTAMSPSVYGSATLERGTLRLGRNLFEVERGVVEFNGFPSVPPSLDFVATTDVSGTTIRMALEGPADRLEPGLSSPDDARLTEQELASLLLTGTRASTDGNETAGAVSAQAAARLGDLFQKQVGLGLIVDVPTTMPVLESTQSQQNVVTVGKAITDNLKVGYNVGLEQSESQFWVLDYQPTKRIWFRAFQESSEVYTVELAHRLSLRKGRGGVTGQTRRTVGGVTITGIPDEVSVDELRRRVKLETGEPYSFAAGRKAADAVENRLRGLGYRDARVLVVTEVSSDVVEVELRVTEGKRVEFVWSGDPLSEKQRRRVEGQWSPGLAVDFQAADLAARAEAELRATGFLWARVEPSVESEEDFLRLGFEVSKGEPGGHLEVDFEGNSALSDEFLLDTLPDTAGVDFFFRAARRPGSLGEDLALGYASEGFLDADLLEIEWQEEPAGADRRVVLRILEGSRAQFGAIVFEGNEDLESAELLEAAGLEPGGAARLEDYVQAKGRLRDLYRDDGFFGSQVESRVERSAQTVDVFFQIVEGRRAKVAAIEVTGNLHTLESVILRRLTFEVGEDLSLSAIDASRRRLYELGMFRSVEIDHRLGEDPTTRVVTVRVTERDRVVLDYGLRYRSDDVENLQPTLTPSLNKGLEVVFRPQYRMPFKRADVFEFSLFLNTESVNGRLGYRVPNFFGTYLPTEIYYQHEEKEYRQIGADSTIDALTFLQQHRLSPKLRLQWSYSIENGVIDVIDAPSPFDLGVVPEGRFWRGSITTSLIGDRRDEFFSPKRGHLWTATVQRADRLLGSDYDFTNVFGQIAIYTSLGGSDSGWVWAQSYRLGAIFSQDRYFDLDSRFTAGGPFSVRGFEPGSLGIFTTPEGLVIGGRSVAILNQELRFPIWRQLRGGAFLDVGNVFAEPGDLDASDLRATAGLGLRLELPFGVFRGDYGWILDREEGEPTGRFHFAFGQAF